MIDTPEFAVNPKALGITDRLENGDAIAVEKASGFGKYIGREGLAASVAVDSIDVMETATVNVADRTCDLFVRAISSSAMEITVSGVLPIGRRLVVDASLCTGGLTLTAGGISWELAHANGEFVLVSHGDAWLAPSVTVSKLYSQGNVSVGGSVDSPVRLNDYIYPKQGSAWILIELPRQSQPYIIPRGIWLVHPTGSEYNESTQQWQSSSIVAQVNYSGTWIACTPGANFAAIVISDGVDFRVPVGVLAKRFYLRQL